MPLNTEPYALLDLFHHVAAGRATAAEIDALIGWLQKQRTKLTGAEAEPVEVQRLQILLAWEAGELTEGRATALLKQYGGLSHGRLEARELKQKAIEAGKNLPFPKPLKVVE